MSLSYITALRTKKVVQLRVLGSEPTNYLKDRSACHFKFCRRRACQMEAAALPERCSAAHIWSAAGT